MRSLFISNRLPISLCTLLELLLYTFQYFIVSYANTENIIGILLKAKHITLRRIFQKLKTAK